jgi:hypothetical protein
MKHFLDERLGLLTDLTPFFLREAKFSSQNFLVNDLVCFSIEGRDSREHNVQNNTQGPDIAFLVVLLFNYFRGDVVNLELNKRYATNLECLCLVIPITSSSSKINNF